MTPSDNPGDPGKLFDRRPFGHEAGRRGSEYDFETLVVKLEGALFKQPAMEQWALPSAIAHECGHWNQHHGTSLGAFLSGIRAAQTQLFDVVVLGFKDASKNKLFDSLISGRPIVELDDDSTSLKASDLDDDPHIAWLRRTWFSLQQAYALFLDTDSLTLDWTIKPIDIAIAIQNVQLAYNSIATGQPYMYDMEQAGQLERLFSDQVVVPHTSRGQFISVRNLFEAACLASEAHFLQVDTWYLNGVLRFPEAAVKQMQLRLDDGGPISTIFADFRQQVEQIGFLGNRTQDLLRTFLLLCDLAVNPPLPPMWDYTELSTQAFELAFDQIHPVGRFYKLVKNLVLIGLYRGELDKVKMKRYQEAASDAAGFRRLSTYQHCLVQWEQLNRDSLTTDLTPADTIIGENRALAYIKPLFWLTYVTWVQCSFWAHRQELLPFIVFGRGSMHSSEIEHSHYWEVDDDRLWTKPLLATYGDDELRSDHPDLAVNVMASAAISWAVFTLFACANIDLRTYPRVCRPLLSAAIRSLVALLDSSASE
jgi:hypothetical protein